MEFVSSTVHLLSVLGKEHLLKNADSRNPRDSYPVWSALNGLKNDLYASLGKDEYKNGTWPATEELMNAMRAWLAEFQEDFVAQEVALVLVRCGCRAETTIDSLNPWFK